MSKPRSKASGGDNAEAYHLTGFRYSPLPYESTYSALMRLAWLNAFNLRDLIHYCIGLKRSAPWNRDMGFPRWIKTELLYQSTGWVLPSAIEREIDIKFERRFYSLFSYSTLKYCPICLQSLYHSFWFQLDNLHRCPIHHCSLKKVCMHCGSESPPYRFEREVFDHPYLCRFCGNTFFGAPLEIELHLEMRNNIALLQAAFRDYHLWLERFDPEKLVSLWPDDEMPDWSDWCDVSGIRLHYINQISKMPLEIAPNPRKDLTVLCWKIRMLDNGKWIRRNRLVYQNRGDMLRTLKVFLRHIKAWVFINVSDEEQRSIESRFIKEDFHDPQTYDPKHLAYLLVAHTHKWGFGPRKGELGFMDDWCNRVPKVAYCAYLYSIYAGLYHKLHRLRRRQGVARDHHLCFIVENYSIILSDVSDEGVHFGRTIFPTIDGLPILLRFGS